ncbi:MAG: NUDIX hydrolase [Chthoniobacterales bacterium]
MDGWHIESATTEFDDGHVTVVREKLRTPSRATPRAWTTVRRKSAVVIAPVTSEGRIVLIRQERIPIRETIWEMPAGQVDEVCESGSFKAVALRELREETGYELAPHGGLTLLGDFFSSPGFTDERAFLVIAHPVQPGAHGHAHDETEAIIDCREFSFAELRQMIADEQIRDANTLSMFARIISRGLLS